MLAYCGLLAAVAGWVDSVALLVWEYPVGNLTALITEIGAHTTDPQLHPAGMIVADCRISFGVSGSGAVLATAPRLFGLRQATVLFGEAVLLFAAAGIKHPLPGMPIRITHFTGTITDVGLLAARSYRHGVDHWKAAVLVATVLLFIGGAAGGVIIGGRIGNERRYYTARQRLSRFPSPLSSCEDLVCAEAGCALPQASAQDCRPRYTQCSNRFEVLTTQSVE